MKSATRIKQRIERLERRREGIEKRLDGVERFDEVRHQGMKAAVELVERRYGRTLSDAELIEAVKEELDRRASPPGVWEAISDFGIRLCVDVAVLHARNRSKFLRRRLSRVEARLERQRSALRRYLESEAEPVSFSIDGSDEEIEPTRRAGLFAHADPRPGEGAPAWDVLPLLLMRLGRLEQAVAELRAEDEVDDLEALELDDVDDADA